MKTRSSYIIIVCMLLFASLAQGQAIGPQTSEDFPFDVGIIMDGGTFFIYKKASKDSAAQDFCIDGQFDSKTKGELYENALHPTHEKARVVSYEKAIKLFTNFRNQLIDYFGERAFEEIEANPIDLENTNEEDLEKLLANPKNDDRIACQMLLKKIEKYKQKHLKKSEQAYLQ